jgi:zinc/manganese transport system substrate-binding protein
MSANNSRFCPRVVARLVVTAAIAAGALAACGTSSAGTRPGVVDVVAAENVWGNITGQIGGSHVTVTSIITDPNADPHTYETDPRDASAVNSASLVVENGAGYDDFIDKLLSVNGVSSRDVLNLSQAVGAGTSPNPHLWYNPAYVTKAAHAIEAHLASRDTADARVFEANLQTFLSSYQPYIDTVATIKSRYAGSPIGYTERVPGYLVEAAGLRLATPPSFAQAIEDGNDPSPADTAAMDDAVSHKAVEVLLYNSQVTSPVTQHVKDLATASGVPVVGVAESIPAGEPSFQRWQLDQAEAILAALGG